MLSQCQVIATVAQVEAAVVVFTEGGHQNTTLVLLTEGEVAKRHRNGQRQVFQYHVGRSRDHVFLGFDLGLGELEIEVRMFVVVTGGVTAVLDVIVVVLGLLGDAAGEVALALLGDDIGDVAALRLEVVLHLPGLVLAAIILKDRSAGELTHTVRDADGLHLAAIHIHADLRCRHVDVAIHDLAAAVHHRMVAAKEDDTVLGIEFDDMVKVDLLAHKAHRVTGLRLTGTYRSRIAFGLDNRVNRLGQVKGISPHLAMRQSCWQQKNCQQRPQDDMMTSYRHLICLLNGKDSANW